MKEALEHLLATTQSRSNHYELRGENLMRHLGNRDCNGLQLQDITTYIKARLDEAGTPLPRPPAAHKWWGHTRKRKVCRLTIHKELTALGRALRLARKRGLYKGHVEDIFPDDFTTGHIPRSRWLTPDEFRRLVKELRPARALWVTLAVYLGARRSEVNGLRWEHIDFGAGLVQLHGTKTAGAHRAVPLPKPLADYLADLRQPSGPVVEPWNDAAGDLAVPCRRAKVEPRCTPNDLRRTYASWLAQGGASSLVIAKLLGHTSTQMAERVYARLGDATKADAVAGLPKLKKARKA